MHHRLVRRLILVLLIFAFGYQLYVSPSRAQIRLRTAQSQGFLVGAENIFDHWGPNDTAHAAFWGYGAFPDQLHRLVYMPSDTDIHLNMDNHGYLDFPGASPVDTDILKQPAPFDKPYLMVGPTRIQWLTNNGLILRFECERHTAGSIDNEYPGFLKVGSLVGSDTSDPTATFPSFLKSTPVAGDTAKNCVRLRTSYDHAGTFDSAFWSPEFMRATNNIYAWTEDGGGPGRPPAWNRKLLLRIRVRLDSSTVNLSLHTPIFVATVSQDTLNGTTHPHLVLMNDTVFTDAGFLHAGTGFDTVGLPFLATAWPDSTFITLRWLGTIPITADYAEVLTRRVDSVDLSGIVDTVHVNGYGYLNPPNWWIAGDSYEGLTSNNDSLLRQIIAGYVAQDSGHVNLIQFPEEPPYACQPIMKRMIKLLRQYSHGSMEFVDITHDSSEQNVTPIPFYRYGLPNQATMFLEGARLGWVDTSLYADPRFYMVEPYIWGYLVPTPRRTPATGTALATWENHYALSGEDTAGVYNTNPYSLDGYRTAAQVAVKSYLNCMRLAKRVCIRNEVDSQRFLVAWQTGMTPIKNSVPGHPMQKLITNLRAPSAPELFVTANLAVSCGASGLFLYAYTSGTAATGGYNGGIMTDTGTHNTNFWVDSLLNADGISKRKDSSWAGWAISYPAVKQVIPMVTTYGDTLLHSKYLGDRTVVEAISTDSFPYVYNTIRALNDSGQMDHFAIDTSNRTLVHVSVWLDTAHGQNDTLLYITNMRTDDSYIWADSTHTDSIPSTMDHRLITLQMKAAHYINDVLDSGLSRYLDNGRVWTPYVGAGDSLRVLLGPGDGILVHLTAAPPQPSAQMQVAISYPKVTGSTTQDFNNYGRVNFDSAVVGSKLVNGHQSVPSTWHSFVGVANSSAPRLNQDSLLYRTVTSRQGNWRNHEVVDGSTVKSSFVDTVGASSIRGRQVSRDSVAHPITITTDVEKNGAVGVAKLFDPWFVDSTSLRNFNTTSDTLQLNPPWLPGYGSLNGGDKQHYGGVFHFQNDGRISSSIPMYALSAYATLRKNTFYASDSLANIGDYSFIGWYKTDSIAGFADPEDWRASPGDMMCFLPTMPVVFRWDSALYAARYKAHMASFDKPNYWAGNGFLWNNQRKLFYLYTDSLNNAWYRIVYASGGRIFTAFGSSQVSGTVLNFLSEHVVSDWFDTSAMFPAMMVHSLPALQVPHVVYQATGGASENQIMEAQPVDPTEHFYQRPIQTTTGGYYPLWTSTPAISGTDYHNGWVYPLDVVAWAAMDGIHIVVADYTTYPALTQTPDTLIFHSPLWALGDTTDTSASFPTVWMDSAWSYDSVGAPTTHFWVAWQADTLGRNPSRHCICDHTGNHDTTTSIYAIELQAYYRLKPSPILTVSRVPGEHGWPIRVSDSVNFLACDARHPCISGSRIDSVHEIVRVSYEVTELTSPLDTEGITVAQWRTGAGWASDKLFPTNDPSDNGYHRPSIECSRYHGDSLSKTPHNNYYSLAYDAAALGVLHWAYDSATNRIISHPPFGGNSYPQLSVVPSSLDSLIRELNISVSGPPYALGTNYGGLFKVGSNDSIWEYRDVSEWDSSATFHVQYGLGEITVDDGSNLSYLDLADRDDFTKIDSNHNAAYILSSKAFTLPATGTLNYFRWVRPTDDSLFTLHLSSVKYALDFYDSTENFICRLDSMTVNDTVSKTTMLQSIPFSRNTASRGHLEFRRVSSNLMTENAHWQDIITRQKYSTDTTFKKSAWFAATSPDIPLSAAPNPLTQQTAISFRLPATGAASLEIHDVLGRTVTTLAEKQNFRAGQHTLFWSTGVLPSGVYIAVLRYGNSTKTLRLSVLK
jgi:hypothetical protein